MATSTANEYGRFYFCVKTRVSKNGEIYVFADGVSIEPGGELVLWRSTDHGKYPNLSLAKGHWSAVFAASLIDGHPVAVEHWKGELFP